MYPLRDSVFDLKPVILKHTLTHTHTHTHTDEVSYYMPLSLSLISIGIPQEVGSSHVKLSYKSSEHANIVFLPSALIGTPICHVFVC